MLIMASMNISHLGKVMLKNTHFLITSHKRVRKVIQHLGA
jgi:hypothetical protein